MPNEEKLVNFLRDALETNHEAWMSSEYNGERDPYWLGRMVAYQSLLERLRNGEFG